MRINRSGTGLVVLRSLCVEHPLIRVKLSAAEIEYGILADLDN